MAFWRRARSDGCISQRLIPILRPEENWFFLELDLIFNETDNSLYPLIGFSNRSCTNCRTPGFILHVLLCCDCQSECAQMHESLPWFVEFPPSIPFPKKLPQERSKTYTSISAEWSTTLESRVLISSHAIRERMRRRWRATSSWKALVLACMMVCLLNHNSTMVSSSSPRVNFLLMVAILPFVFVVVMCTGSCSNQPLHTPLARRYIAIRRLLHDDDESISAHYGCCKSYNRQDHGPYKATLAFS